MKISSAVFILVAIFAINLLLYGFGLTNPDFVNQTNPLNSNLNNITDITTKPETSVIESEAGGNLTDNQDVLRALPDSGTGYDNYKMIKDGLSNLVWGYRNAFVVLGLPTILLFLFTGIIGFIQVLCLFTIIGSFISVFTGGGFR